MKNNGEKIATLISQWDILRETTRVIGGKERIVLSVSDTLYSSHYDVDLHFGYCLGFGDYHNCPAGPLYHNHVFYNEGTDVRPVRVLIGRFLDELIGKLKTYLWRAKAVCASQGWIDLISRASVRAHVIDRVSLDVYGSPNSESDFDESGKFDEFRVIRRIIDTSIDRLEEK